MTDVPLSILDLAPISQGSDAATALRNSVDLAQHAEDWGYKRHWVAEHHFAAVASSQPALLIGQIAGATDTLRVGAAAVQLGHTTAVAVAESFGMLDALHPGRIDLGVGRSAQKRQESGQSGAGATPVGWREVDGVPIPPPFDMRSIPEERLVQATALLQPGATPPDFAEQVADIEALLAGRFCVAGYRIKTVPEARNRLSPWIFGSSRGQSAQVAAARGLPFVASYHITPGTALDAVQAYRSAFKPSDHLHAPYVVVSADVVVADDTATAEHHARGYGPWVYSIRAGNGAIPYPDPDTVAPLDAAQRAVVADRVATQFVGTADDVAARLQALQRVTQADELVITTITHRHADRLRSYELIAKRWGISG